MILSHKIKLNPNNKQKTYFKKACGCSRLAYNYALEQWGIQYNAGGKPSAFALKKEFNAVKKEKFPFVYEVTKTACERAFTDLEQAFKKFFKKTAKYPRFKKKGQKDSFYISAQYIKIEGNKLKIPKLGWVRMTEALRLHGKLLSVTISKTAGMWFVSINVDVPEGVECSDNQVHYATGVDLGISKLAVLADGTMFENPKNTKIYERRLRRLNKSLARKTKGSSNWKKAKLKLSKLHHRIKWARQDAIHKMTTWIGQNYSDVCIEDLNVKGMVKNIKLAKAVSDASFSEIRRQLEYKCLRVHVIDRFFPSTKLCMECGQLHVMPLHKRIFECDCGANPPMDRDHHAAQNLLRQGLPKAAQ